MVSHFGHNQNIMQKCTIKEFGQLTFINFGKFCGIIKI